MSEYWQQITTLYKKLQVETPTKSPKELWIEAYALMRKDGIQ